MEKLTIFRTSKGWMVQSDDPEIQRLFDTDTLPLPWSAQADMGRVLADVCLRNPTAQVALATDWDRA